MKKKNILHRLVLWLVLPAVLPLQSCENEETTSHSGDMVSFSIAGSRATETAFETGDAIGVYAVVRMTSAPAALKVSGNYADNKKFVWNGTQFVADGDENEIVTGYETDYFVYYPYQEGMHNPLDHDFSIQADQRGGTTLSDLMYAATTGGTTDKVIPLDFIHLLSRLQVTYTPEEGETLSEVLISKIATTAEVNLGTGVVRTLDAVSDVRMSKDGDTFTAIIPAQERDAGGTFLTLSFADGTKKDYSLTEKKVFLAGHTTVLPFMGKELQYEFTVTPSPIQAIAKGGDYSYTISTKKFYTINGVLVPGSESELGYTVEGESSWITFDKDKKSITVEEHTGDAARSGRLVFTQAESGRTANIDITQDAASVVQRLLIETPSGNIPATGGDKTVTGTLVTYYNGSVTPSKTEEVTVTLNGKADGFTTEGNKVTAGNNTSESERTITVTGTYNGITSEGITITQSAGSKQYGEWSGWTVSVSANPSTIASTGGTSAITATATRTRTWTWNGVANSGGTETGTGTPALSASGTGFSLSGTTLTAGNNTGTSSRSCTVTATHEGKSASCKVTQSGGTTSYGDWVINISASPTTVAASGGTSTITATATRDILTNGVKTGTDTGTVTLSKTGSGTLSGSTVTFGNNTGTSSRSCTVTASYGGKSDSVTITQSAGSPTTEYGSWSTSSLSVSASPTSVAASGGSSTLKAVANQVRDVYTKWNGITTSTTQGSQSVDVSSSATWSGSATGFSRSGTSVSVSNNTSTSSRSCTYTASYGGKSGSVTITQSGASLTYGYIFTLDSTSGDDVVSGGGTVSYTVTSKKITYANGTEISRSDISYSASADVNWITAGTTSSTVSANPNTSSRSGKITLTQSESGKTLTISVFQKPKVSVDID